MYKVNFKVTEVVVTLDGVEEYRELGGIYPACTYVRRRLDLGHGEAQKALQVGKDNKVDVMIDGYHVVITPTQIDRPDQSEKGNEFLGKLYALLKEYNAELSGCGCCGSPSIGSPDWCYDTVNISDGIECEDGKAEITEGK